MPNVLLETRHSGGFLISEANGFRSRDAGTYVNATGADLLVVAGTVLASGAEGNAVVTRAGTGNGTLGALAFGAAAAIGATKFTATSATNFTGVAPNGAALPAATVGAAYADAELAFTITAGGTAFVAGDSFTITVSPADASYVPWTNTSPAVAIFYNTEIIPAGATAKVTVVSRTAEVNAAELVYDPSITGSTNPTPSALFAIAQQQLRAAGIVSR